MYLAGVSVRRVEDITEALLGTLVSPSTVSNLNKKRSAGPSRPGATGRSKANTPYVYLDGHGAQRSWAGEIRNVSPLVAIAMNGFSASAKGQRR